MLKLPSNDSYIPQHYSPYNRPHHQHHSAVASPTASCSQGGCQDMTPPKASDVNWVDGDTYHARLTRLATTPNPSSSVTATSNSSRKVFRFLDLAPEIRNRIYGFYMLNAKKSSRKPSVNRHKTYHDAFPATELGPYDDYIRPHLRDQCGNNNNSVSTELWYGHPQVYDRNCLFSCYQNHLTRPLMPRVKEPALTRVCYEIRFQCLPMWYHQFTTILRISTWLDDGDMDAEPQSMREVVEPDTVLDELPSFTDNQLRMMGSLRFATDQTWNAGYDAFGDHRQWLAIARFLKVSVAAGLEFESFHQSIRHGMPMFVPLKEKYPLVLCNNINGLQPTAKPERFWDGLTARSLEAWTSIEFFQRKVDQSKWVINYYLEAFRKDLVEGSKAEVVRAPTRTEVARCLEATKEEAKQSGDDDST